MSDWYISAHGRGPSSNKQQTNAVSTISGFVSGLIANRHTIISNNTSGSLGGVWSIIVRGTGPFSFVNNLSSNINNLFLELAAQIVKFGHRWDSAILIADLDSAKLNNVLLTFEADPNAKLLDSNNRPMWSNRVDLFMDLTATVV